jgi:hypothetical protein
VADFRTLSDEGVDAQLRLDGARVRSARAGCPPPDAILARHSELMEPALRDALARHLGACDACRRFAADLDALEACDTVSREVETRVLARVRARAVPPPRWRLAVAAAMLLVCAGSVVWWVRSSASSIKQSAAAVRPASPPPPVGTPVAALWKIDPPAVRLPLSSIGATRSGGGEGAASRALPEALAPYQAGKYAEAIGPLQTVARAHPTSSDAAFYLGAAFLLADRPRDALGPLERAAALGPPTRRAEIDWYRATAEQRAGLPDAARTRLNPLCAGGSEFRARACAAARTLR